MKRVLFSHSRNRVGRSVLPELPPSVVRFREAAERLGHAPRIVLHASPARTAEEAAGACGCDLGQIVKSLVFRGAETALPLLFLVSGRHRLDEARAAGAAGETILRAHAGAVREATGYAIGGIPPFGHARPYRTFMDRALLDCDVVWAAAGHPNAVFAIAPHELQALTGAITVEM